MVSWIKKKPSPQLPNSLREIMNLVAKKLLLPQTPPFLNLSLQRVEQILLFSHWLSHPTANHNSLLLVHWTQPLVHWTQPLVHWPRPLGSNWFLLQIANHHSCQLVLEPKACHLRILNSHGGCLEVGNCGVQAMQGLQRLQLMQPGLQ